MMTEHIRCSIGYTATWPCGPRLLDLQLEALSEFKSYPDPLVAVVSNSSSMSSAPRTILL